MAFAGLAGAVGAYLQGKRQRQMQDQQLAEQQQKDSLAAQIAQAQLASAQQRTAQTQQQIALAYRKAGLNPDGTPIKLPTTPGIVAGPGGPPKLPTITPAVMGGAPTQSLPQAKPPAAPAPAPTAAPTPGATAGTPTPAAPQDGPTVWAAQAQSYQTQAVALYQQAADLEKRASVAGENGESDVATRLQQEANGLRQTGASYVALSTSLMTRSHQVNQDAVAFANAEERARHDHAEEHHWTAQEQAAAKAEADRIKVEVRNGTLSYSAAMARVGATYAGIDAANARNAASIGAANDRAAAGRAVTIRGQDLTNKRATATAAAGAAGRSNAAAVTTLRNSNQFTGLPAAVQGYISSSIQKNGVEKVYGALRGIANGTTTDPNVTQDQAQRAVKAMGL